MAKNSSGLKRRGIGRLSAVLATAVTAAGFFFFVAPTSAWALGPGKYCLYLAPSGAMNLGHVGWEFQEPGRGYWAGAKEGSSGGSSDSWMVFATSETTIHSDFKNAMPGQHDANYYTEYRCHSTTTSAVGAAIAKAKAEASGYNLVTDNCLIKSVAIFTTYWGGDHLQSGFGWTPNDYFNNYLPSVNWGPIHYL